MTPAPVLQPVTLITAVALPRGFTLLASPRGVPFLLAPSTVHFLPQPDIAIRLAASLDAWLNAPAVPSRRSSPDPRCVAARRARYALTNAPLPLPLFPDSLLSPSA